MSFHSYRGQPSSTRVQQAGGNWSQQKTRHQQSSFDQHGRRWSWSADNRSGMPASIKSPDFSAPWYPDDQYIRINPDDTTEAYIDYPAMFRDRKSALMGYHREAVRFAQRRNQPVPKLGHYTDDIVEAVGLPPRALEMIAAAAQGHPWVLGATDVPDPRLVAYLETPSTDTEKELDEFDFGTESYHAAVGRAPATTRERPKKFTSLAELEAAADALKLPVGEMVGEEDELQNAETVDALSDFDGLDGETLDDDELGDESVDATNETSNDVLLDLEDEHDPTATGGMRVDPRNQDKAERQAARRPGQTSVNRKHGQRRSAGTDAAPTKPKGAWNPNKGKSLADGAKPFVGSV